MSYAVESMPKWSAQRSVNPTVEPVSLNDVKDFCKITSEGKEPELNAFITAARTATENYLNRTLITTTWVMRMNGFPSGEIVVPFSPLLTVSSIAYDSATDGSSTTLSSGNYQTDIYSEPGLICPAYGYYWPAARDQYNSVRVTYTAGYGPAASDVPGPIKHAILVLVNTLDLHREKVLTGLNKTEIEEVAGYLLYPYRVWWM